MKLIQIGAGAQLAVIRDDRFQTVRISAHFMMPVVAEKMAAYALLPRLLPRGCARYPDYTAFNRKLAMLYGAGITGSVQMSGETEMIHISLGMLDDRYVPDGESILAEGIGLLCDVMFDPVLDENGWFRAADVAEEKRNLTEEIRAELNDKRGYALRRAREIMFDGEPYGAPRQGTPEDVEALTPAGLTEEWKTILRTAPITVTAIGMVDEEIAAAAFAEALKRISRAPVQLPVPVQRAGNALREVTERTEAQQAKLVMGFRVQLPEDGNTMPLRLGTVLLGGTPSSRLFKNVRERLSLCYYCAARCDWNKGVLMVDSGVQEDKAAQVRAEVLHQLEELQQGRFDAEELEIARRAMIDQFGSVSDSVGMLDGWYTDQLRTGSIMTPEEAEARIQAVTAEDIAQALSGVRPELFYLLAGQEEVPNA
ncbi:MAG: insulinase family protein [Clostridia bacterium]|nr:insulinase family protein [Clostridia bacterium]